MEERHALRATTVTPSVSFDGRRGRWNLRNQVGSVLTANMAIRATSAQPLAQYQQCTGAFAQVPVSLTGTFVLRTGTAFFSTIRRVRLRGLVVFNRARSGRLRSGRDCMHRGDVALGDDTGHLRLALCDP